MGKPKRMDQIRSVLSTYLRTFSKRKTARIQDVSKNTVKTYINKCIAQDVDISELLKGTDKELYSTFYSDDKCTSS